jgi:F-type H+-transporting ATPase subunit delta
MKVTATQYATILYNLTVEKPKQEIDGVIYKFINVLRKNNQLKLADKIIAKFNDICNQKHGIVEAKVTTRYKIPTSPAGGQDTMTKQIEKYIKEKYKAKEVIIKNKIDENIKGGIVIKVGDEILDASVEGKLKKLESILSR